MKILKNTTLTDILLDKLGMTILASSSVTISPKEYLLLSTVEVLNELYTFIDSGDIVVNNGVEDLTISIGKDFLKYPDNALNITFNPDAIRSNGLYTTTVQEAIEEVKSLIKPKTRVVRFQILGTVNYNQYLYSGLDKINLMRRSNSGNGYNYQDCSLEIILREGVIKLGGAVVQGLAVSSGTPNAIVNINFELWNVGFTNEGSKIADITFDIDSSSTTIGSYWNSSVNSNYKGITDLNIPIDSNTLIALKFISITGNSDIVSAENITVSLELECTN